MASSETFDSLYDELASSREAHRLLRTAHPSITALAESTTRLYQARMAMWDWHVRPRTVTG